MICPHCRTEINEVKVYSEYVETACLAEGSTHIVSFSGLEEGYIKTLDVECPVCTGSLSEEVFP